MRLTSAVIYCLLGIALSSLFSDIIKGMVGSDSPTISGFIKGLPHDLLDELENNEQQAGQFVCDILDGDVPGVIENLAEDVWSEIEDDWSAVTDFIASLPTLAPEVLEDIIQDGEDVVSVIGELFTDPEAAITVIESGIEVVVSDITSVGGDVISFFKCLFGDCSTSTTPPDAAATLSASCQAIMAAATTTYSPTAAATTTTTYPAAQTSYYSSPAAATTTTFVQAAPTTSTEIEAIDTTSAAPTTSTEQQPETTSTPDSEGGAAETTTFVQSSPTQTTQQQQPTTTNSVFNGSSGSESNRALTCQIWLGILVCFLFVVTFL